MNGWILPIGGASAVKALHVQPAQQACFHQEIAGYGPLQRSHQGDHHEIAGLQSSHQGYRDLIDQCTMQKKKTNIFFNFKGEPPMEKCIF